MLILTRRTGETLMIGDDVKITILKVSGNQIRIGVEAPKDVSVHREEVYQRVLQDKQSSGEAESIRLNQQAWERLNEVIENPQAPTDALKDLMKA